MLWPDRDDGPRAVSTKVGLPLFETAKCPVEALTRDSVLSLSPRILLASHVYCRILPLGYVSRRRSACHTDGALHAHLCRATRMAPYMRIYVELVSLVDHDFEYMAV